ncbi:sulfite exporter TauE/SafE family protein [Desemzia sp. RIT804]|nr:sulfite exporter TauE/SafE family protein [Desemzia sp. RIT 804]
MFLLGLFLGVISIFLGIGGGLLNVSLLVIFFGYTLKQASVYSVATVFFSQITKIIIILIGQQHADFDLSLVPWLILVGIVGGYYGTRINQRISNAAIGKIYNVFMLGMCALTIFNIVRFL